MDTEATPTLQSLIHQEIRQHGPLSFDRYMSLALYHDELGYYTKGEQNIGKEGDFFTSVSVGSTFGTILAHRIHAYWQEINCPDEFPLIELAANNGQLAHDILSEIRHSFPALFPALQYHICEHLDAMTATQSAKLAEFAPHVHLHSSPSELSKQKRAGVILSNELIDAMPVRLLKKKDQAWQELLVSSDGNQFHFQEAPIECPELKTFADQLPADLPENYTTEYRPGLDDFCLTLSTWLNQGLVITIDYGYTRQNFYSPHRSDGTLRTYHRHQATDTPLESPGEQDITAHVDFTQLAEAFTKAGFGLTSFSPQAQYLTKHGAGWLQSLEKAPRDTQTKLIRQFQTLTHPSMMGNKFLVLECKLNKPSSPRITDLTEHH